MANARLGAVSVDCADPTALADFYTSVLDLEPMFRSEEFVALKGAAVLLTFQLVADHRPASWPDGPTVLIDPAGHPFCITNMIPDAD